MAPSFNTWSIYTNDGSTLIGTIRLLANSSDYIVVENGIRNTSGDATWTYDGTIIGLATTPNATTPTYAVGDRFFNSNYTFYIIVAEASQPSEIRYQGSVIGSLSKGQTATLTCAGKKATGNIAAVFGSDGTITYNGVSTQITSGTTATLACAGKKMVTDVVITISS